VARVKNPAETSSSTYRGTAGFRSKEPVDTITVDEKHGEAQLDGGKKEKAEEGTDAGGEDIVFSLGLNVPLSGPFRLKAQMQTEKKRTAWR